MDFPLPTGPYGFPSLTNNRSFEAYSSMCRQPLHEIDHKIFINGANILELCSQPTSKLRGENLPSHWSAVNGEC